MVLENLEPKIVWKIFEELIAATPRSSKKEDKIRARLKNWLIEISKEKNKVIRAKEDESGNMFIKIPATAGYEKSKSILLQAHLDMVCESDRPKGYDFDHFGIPLKLSDDKEWVEADGTTLGADDGIGIALILAMIVDDDPNFQHGPVEILLTTDEETGLTGAFKMNHKLLSIQSHFMINVDSEDLGIITIGSAGGADTRMIKICKKMTVSKDHLEHVFMELKVSGLIGGHSGVDIHLPRGNANKIIARIVSSLSKNCEICVCRWNGGIKHNVITRESEIKFSVPKDKAPIIKRVFEKEKQNIMNYYKGNPIFEPNLSINLKDSFPEPFFSPEDSVKIITSANILPHGVIRMSPTVKDLVETSNNFAVVKTDDNKIEFVQASRSNIDSELESVRKIWEDIGKLGGWEIIHLDAYPGWKPEPESPFLKFISKIYEEKMQKPIKIEAIHAGLETGVIGAKIPGMQMVSIGPTIKNAHTPDEKLNIADVKVMYEILKEILFKFCSF